VSPRVLAIELDRIRDERAMLERQLATAEQQVTAGAASAAAARELERRLVDVRPRLAGLDAAGRRALLTAWMPGAAPYRATVDEAAKVRLPIVVGAAVGLAVLSAYRKPAEANEGKYPILLLVA
jgi:hypothetical protein